MTAPARTVTSARATLPQPSAIGKVAAVVEALAEHRSTTEIARSAALPVSTVHRILQELVKVGWAREDGERGYLLGARLLTVAGRATDHETMTRIARPFLRELSDRTGHAVHFAVRVGDEAVYVDKLEGSRAYHMRSRVGLAIPLHCTAIGKALLAQDGDLDVRALLSRTGMVRRTPNTLTSRERMVAHLAVVRSRGYSLDDEENELQTRCIGAAVHDHHGQAIGGVSLSMLAFELDEARVIVLAPLVVQTAGAVTAALGGKG